MRIHQLGTDTNEKLTDTTRIAAHVLVKKWSPAKTVHVTSNLKRAYVPRNG